MPLNGTFDVLDFTAVLELLASRQMTGRLHVRSRSFGANLFLEEGFLIGADQSDHQAAAVSGDVSGRLEEICFELLELDRGNFEFHPGRSIGLPTVTALPVDEVIRHARHRLNEWHELQKIFPSLEIQPRVIHEIDSGAVTLDRERWRVLTAVDGRRNLRAIGRTLNLSDYDTCRFIRDLLEAGVVQIEDRPAAVAGIAGTIDLDGPLTTEQVTINGRVATRVRAVVNQTESQVQTRESATSNAVLPEAAPLPPAVQVTRNQADQIHAGQEERTPTDSGAFSLDLNDGTVDLEDLAAAEAAGEEVRVLDETSPAASQAANRASSGTSDQTMPPELPTTEA